MTDDPAGHDPDRTQVIRTGRGAAPAGPPAARGGGRAPDAPPGAGVRRPGQPGQSSGRPAYDSAAAGQPTRAVPQRPGGRPPGGPDGPGGPAAPPPRPGARRRRRLRLVRTIVVILVLAVIAYPFLVAQSAWSHLDKTAALPTGGTDTPGRVYLVVGSDSRRGLTAAQQKSLHVGHDVGQRTDTIMLLEVPASGPTVLMSIPRDSYVAVPGHGMTKINSSYAYGGSKLLAQTVENATKIHVDDYVEIGFGGFATMVDAVNGVQICPKRNMDDPKAGINLKKGCQQADGRVALGYARARYSDPLGDLGRVQRQREVLAAIFHTASSPATLANPFRTFPLAKAGGSSLQVDDGMSRYGLARFLLGMKAAGTGKGVSLTVPVSGTANKPGAGSVVLWDQAKAESVFKAMRSGDTNAVKSIAAAEAK